MITFSKPDLPHQQNQLAKRQNVRMFSCLSDIWLLPLHESVLVLPLIMMNKTFTNLSQFVDLLSCATACHLNFMNGALFSFLFLFFFTIALISMYTLPGEHEGGGWKSACCFEVWPNIFRKHFLWCMCKKKASIWTNFWASILDFFIT